MGKSLKKKRVKATADRARTPEEKQEMRERILRESISLFVEEGYHGFTMRRLAARLGCTATAIYSYFKNKDDIILEVVVNGYDLLQKYMTVDEPDPLARVRAYARAYLKFGLENRELYQLLFTHRPQYLFDTNEDRVASRLQIIMNIATAFTQLPVLAGRDFESLRSTAVLLWSWMHGVVSLTLTVPYFEDEWTVKNVEAVLQSLETVLHICGTFPEAATSLYQAKK